MTAPAWLLSLPVVCPLFAAVLLVLLPPKALPWTGRLAALATAATTLPPLRWAWTQGTLRQSLGGWSAPLGIELHLDGLTALLLLFSAATGLVISLHAASYFHPAADGRRQASDLFWPLWFLVWGGLQAMFLSADLFNLYVTLELISVAAVGLVALTGTPEALRAAFRYQLLALLGALAYLLGVGLFYNAVGTLDLAQVTAQLRPEPLMLAGMALMVVGLMVKVALFPLHFWLPKAHANAPAPVSAALSGLVVTAAFVLFFRLWYSGLAALAPRLLSQGLGVLGSAAILWGGVLALRQERLKLILAYSTVSQVGYLFLVFGLTGRHPAAEGLVWAGAVYMALSHGLAKTAAFLAAGTLQHANPSDRLQDLAGAAVRHPLAAFALGAASINLMGLPPSAGFIGKWMMLKACFHTGQWGYALVIVSGGLLAAAYLFRVLEVFMSQPECMVLPRRLQPRSQTLPALALALSTVLLALAISQTQALLRVGAPVEFSTFVSPGVAP
jgi:multicomponent Na+:H+ antiporter subunit D